MSTTSALIESIRPRQWLKNAVVFAPLIFSVAFFDTALVVRSLEAFLILCFLASSIYLVNDLRDVADDRRHPSKQKRPIASGRLSLLVAHVSSLLFLVLGMALAWSINPATFVTAGLFLLINLLYSFGGKRTAILDTMLIGASFVARVLVGASAIAIGASAWLLLTLFFLATYLGFSKRAGELRLPKEAQRTALSSYNPVFLEHARSTTLSVTLALYTLYTFASPFGSLMAITVPFVFFGLMRYQAIVDSDTGGNDGPTDHIYKDRQLQITLVCWCLSVLGVIFLTR